MFPDRFGAIIPAMSEPPEPNPDGTYTFSAEAVQELRNAIYRLAQARNDAECIAAIDKAYNILPIPPLLEKQKKEAFEANIQKQMLEYEAANKREPPPPQIIALEKALKERYEKESHLLGQSHRAEMKGLMSEEKYHEIADRQAKEREKLEATYRSDLKRYIQEAKDSQKLIKEMEERERTLKPGAPQRSL